MEVLKIIFMGTPDFAVGILKGLVHEGHTIVGVITAPDRPAGRGQKLHESAVKKYAITQGLTVLQPTNLKNTDFLTTLRNLNANLQIVVAFRMLPKVVWSMPKYGTFNLHASLLPQYRGAAPINWAIINGETKTGVSTFFIDEKIDTGAVIMQEEITIGEEEDAGELHDKLMKLGSQTVLKTVARLEKGNFKTKPQPVSGDLKEAHKLHKETCKIDWTQPIDDIYNKIRGLSPYPTAWTTLYNKEQELFTKIYKTVKQYEAHNLSVGTLIASKKELKIAVNGGYLLLVEMQLQGKRKMMVHDLLNGLDLDEKAYMA